MSDYTEITIKELIKMLKAKDDYKTVIIGLIAGDKEEVIESEQEFDEATSNLLSKNVFIKLSGFTKFKGEDEH